jgi:putative FmdB family regulatory protein
MPLFEFSCDDCGREFEDLLSKAEETDSNRKCPSCDSGKVTRKMSTFGINSPQTIGKDTLVSSKEIDKAVGAASDKGWERHNNRFSKRRDKVTKELDGVKEIVINKGPDGTVRPFQHLGDKKEQTFRKGYGNEYHSQVTKSGKDGDKTQVKMKVSL